MDADADSHLYMGWPIPFHGKSVTFAVKRALIKIAE